MRNDEDEEDEMRNQEEGMEFYVLKGNEGEW